MYVTLGTYSLEAYAKGLYVLDGKDYGTFDAYMTALKKATESAVAESKKARDKELKKEIKSEQKSIDKKYGGLSKQAEKAQKKVEIAKQDKEWEKSDRVKTGKKVEAVAKWALGDTAGGLVGKVAKGTKPSEKSNLKTGLKIAGIVAALAGLGIASYKIAQKIKDNRRDKINFYYQEVVRLSKLRETKGELSKQELEDLARYTTYLAKQAGKEDKNSTLKNAAKLAAVVL